MIKLTTKSFRKSREILTDTPLDIPPSPVSAKESPSIISESPSSPPPEYSDNESSGESDTEKTDPEWSGPCTVHHECKLIHDQEVAVSVDELFTLLFTNSRFYIDYLIRQRNIVDYDISGEWLRDPETGLKTRQISFTLPLSGLGPKEALVTETQIMNKYTRPGERYSVDVWAENGGVPYADSFNVLLHACMTRVTDRRTKLQMYGDVKYKKSVWGIVRTMIEKGTMPGLDNYAKLIERSLTDHTGAGHVRKPRLRRTNTLSSHGSVTDVRAPAPRTKLSSTRLLVGVLMVLLLVVNVQLFFILRHERTESCMLSMDGWEERLSDNGEWEQAEEWAEMLDQFTNKQREQLSTIKFMLDGEIEALRKTEKAVSSMIDKLKTKPRDKPRRRLRLTEF